MLEVRFLRKVSRAAHLIYLVRSSSEASVLNGVKNTVKETLDVITSLNRVLLQLTNQFLISFLAMLIES